MGREGVTTAVHATDAVGVTVGAAAQVVGIFFQKHRAWPVVVDDRLRVDAAEKRVVLGVQRGDLALGAV